MSVFQSILPGIFGPSSSSVDDVASKLEEWLGVRRRARENTRAFYDIKGEMADWSGPISADLVSRMRSAEIQLSETNDQLRAYDAQILAYGQQAVDAGKVDVAALDDYRRRLNDAAGLGAFGLIAALAVGIVLIAGAIAASIVASMVAFAHRANNAAAVQNAALRDAWELEKQQATQQGRPMQTPPAASDASKGSPLVSVGVGAGGIGLLVAAVGGLLLLNSRGRRT